MTGLRECTGTVIALTSGSIMTVIRFGIAAPRGILESPQRVGLHRTCQNRGRAGIVIPRLEEQRPALIAREIENGLQSGERRPAGRGGSSSSDDDIVKEGVGRHVQSPFV